MAESKFKRGLRFSCKKMKNCKICGVDIIRTNEQATQWKIKKCCSKKCRDISQGITSKGIRRSTKTEIKKGQRLSPKTEFKRGQTKEKCINWRGGRMISNGYVLIKSEEHPNRNNLGYYQEHRLVMEEKIGRYLTEEERVHHIDGDRTNNEITNLMLFSSESEHQKHHHFLKQNAHTVAV